MKFFKGLIGKLQVLSQTQKIVSLVAALTTVSVVGGGVAVVATSSDAGSGAAETTEGVSETFEVIEEIIETESFFTEEETTEEIIKDINLTIKTSSILEDLKIKMVDEKERLITGYEFEITLADEENIPASVNENTVLNGKKYKDTDKDGLIHIKELKGGKYMIHLRSEEGIIITKNFVKATVKGELEYEKVDNKDEIKADKPTEDTAQKDVVQEAVLQDTLQLVDSKTYSVEVPKDKADLSALPAGSASKETTITALQQIKKVEGTSAASDENVNPMVFETEETVSVIRVKTFRLSSQIMTIAEETTAAEEETTASASVPAPLTEVIATQPATEPPAAAPSTTEPVTAAPSTTEQPTEPPTTAQPVPESSTTPSTAAPESSTVKPEDTTNSTSSSSTAESSSSTEEKEDTPEDKPSKDEVIGEAKIVLPERVNLFTYGPEASQKAKVTMSIEDEKKLVQTDKITWSISDPTVASITQAKDNLSVDVVMLKAGEATLVAKVPYISTDKNEIKTAEISCKVIVGNHTDNTTQLKTADGKLLYIDGKATKIATPANYAASEKLYTTPEYTGWQTIDGKLYYYSADRKVVTGAQVIGGVQYNFNSDGSLIPSDKTYGIDVSKWQGNIDWTAVKNSGVKFAIIRCGYRGSTDGMIHEDPYFRANIAGATANGIKVGVYFFTQAINQIEAIEEASVAIALVQGYPLQLPIFIDTERAANGRANSLDKATRTAVIQAFCETVRNSGYKPGIYASKSWYYNNLDMSKLSTYNIWVAQYNTSCNYTGRYDLWQYSDSGSVPGIKGKVDMNICYTNY